MSRIRFKWRKQITRGQLLLKSSIPAVLLLLALFLSIVIINGNSRLQLNEMLYRNSTEVKRNPASELYEPMINAFRLSSFWVRTGGITHIDDPETFAREMSGLIAEIPLIEGMTVRDARGGEIDVYRERGGRIGTRLTADEDSLSRIREQSGIEYMALRSPRRRRDGKS